MERWSAMAVNSKPRISVLMTVFNAELYIKEAVDSILMQTFKDWELIVVDNKSTDNTLNILVECKDSRVKLVKLNENIGRVSALRLAYEKASGEYIAILDADDISNLNRLAKQSEHLDSHPNIGLVASWVEFIDQKGTQIGKFKPPTKAADIHQILGFRNITLHSSVMYRKKTADEIGGYSKDFVWGHDFHLILSIAEKNDISILNSFLCRIRILKTSMTRSNNYKESIVLENIMLFKKAGAVLRLNKKSKELNRTAIAIANLKYGFFLASNNKNLFFKGFFLILRELMFNPAIIWRNGLFRRLLGFSF